MIPSHKFQEPFNKVTYALIGDDSATNYFQINAESGVISVSNNLENDGTRTYSVSILWTIVSAKFNENEVFSHSSFSLIKFCKIYKICTHIFCKK